MLGRLLLGAGLYFIIAKFGLLLATINNNASPVWPATGFSIALICFWGPRYWPAIFCGAFLANLNTGAPLWVVTLIATGNMLEALVGYHLYRFFSKKTENFHFQSEAIATLIAGSLGAVISANIGVSALAWGSVIPWASFSSAWITWWVGDFIGALVVLPLLMGLWKSKIVWKKPSSQQIIEWGCGFVAVAVIFYFSLVRKDGDTYLFLMFLPILWAAHMHRDGAKYYAFVACAVCIAMTRFGYGPFRLGTINQNLVLLQLVMSSLAITALLVSGFRKSGNLRDVGIALVIGWTLSGLLFSYMEVNGEKTDKENFISAVREANTKIEKSMDSYVESLRAGASTATIIENLKPNDWKAYIQQLKLEDRYPGVIAMGVVYSIKAAQKAEYLKQMKKQWGFDVKLTEIKKSLGVEYYPVTMLEPSNDFKGAVGLDLATEERRKEAADLARDTGTIALSKKFIFFGKNEGRPGFLLFAPFYKRNTDLTTLEARRKNIIGWVYAPFIAEKLFTGILGSQASQLQYAIFEEGEKVYSSSEKVAAKSEGDFEVISPVKLANRSLLIGWNRAPGYFASHDLISAWAAAGTTLLALFFAAMIANLQFTRQQAELLATEKARLLDIERQKLVNASKMSSLGEMAGGIAHEINNPLAIIKGRVVFVKRALLGDVVDRESILKSAEKIDATVDRIDKIIKGLRSFARNSEADPFNPVSLKQLVDVSLELCSERFKYYGVELKLGQIPNAFVECRESQLEQVLVNLLNNAFDAISGLPQKWIHLEFTEKQDQIQISITDSGRGIPTTIIEKMMEPFFTTKEVGKGTGLGLSISKGIVQEHRGDLYYDSSSPYTKFILELPKAKRLTVAALKAS